MTNRQSLIAFLAVLITMIALYIIAAVMVALDKDIAAVGFGGASTGLIGVLGTFRPANRGAAPIVQTGDSATVNEAAQ